MPTLVSETVLSNTLDADWRRWIRTVHEFFLHAGWVALDSTGDIDFDTTENPTSGYQQIDFKVYRMDDALQGTTPCFVKVWFGSGTVLTYPAFYIQASLTNDDGDLEIGGGPFTRPGLMVPCTNQSTSLVEALMSGDTNRIVFSLGQNWNMAIGFSIERTKDSNGDDDARGFLVTHFAGTGVSFQHTLLANPAKSGHAYYSTFLRHGLPQLNPSEFNNRIVVSPPRTLGFAGMEFGRNLLVVKLGDWATAEEIVLDLFGGSDETPYRLVNTGMYTSLWRPADTTNRLAIRWG